MLLIWISDRGNLPMQHKCSTIYGFWSQILIIFLILNVVDFLEDFAGFFHECLILTFNISIGLRIVRRSSLKMYTELDKCVQ